MREIRERRRVIVKRETLDFDAIIAILGLGRIVVAKNLVFWIVIYRHIMSI